MKVYKFYADWCQPCKMLSRVLEDVDLNGHEIVEIDIDAQGSFAQEFGVRGVPTMVMVDNENKEIKRIVGMAAEAKLNEFFA